MKTFHPTRRQFRQMFRPKTPDLNKLLLHKLTADILNLKKTMEADEKPEVHTTQREGVFYQLQEQNSAEVAANPSDTDPQPTTESNQTPSVRGRRLKGFKAFCEELNNKAETPTLMD